MVVGAVEVSEAGFRTRLNPPEEDIFNAGDRMVFVARTTDDIVPDQILSASPVLPAGERNIPTAEAAPRRARILILGWNHHIPALIRELSTYENESYDITIMSLREIDYREKALAPFLSEGGLITCRQVLADHVNEYDLRQVEPAGFDHILVAGSDRLSDSEEADARTLVGYMLPEEVLENAPKRPSVLTELSEPQNEALIRRFDCERITGPVIISHLLAQIALRRELHAIFTELFTVGGAEIIFRSAEECGIPEGGQYTFAEIENITAAVGDTALGLRLPADSSSGSPSVVLNPARTRKFVFAGGVRIAVLTTVYKS